MAEEHTEDVVNDETARPLVDEGATLAPFIDIGEAASGSCSQGSPGLNGSIGRQRLCSCTPTAERSIMSGPWSLEWLNDRVHGDVDVIFSSKRKNKNNLRGGGPYSKIVATDNIKNKKREESLTRLAILNLILN